MFPITVPTISDLDYYIGASGMHVIIFEDFSSPDDSECDYYWSYEAKLANGTALDPNFITFVNDTKMFRVQALEGTN